MFRSATFLFVVISLCLTSGCSAKPAPIENAIVFKTLRHDANNFTQGLFFYKDYLCESTGIHGASHFMMTKYPKGGGVKAHKLPKLYFGEGATIYGNKLYWLTYEAEVCLVYDMKKFEFEKILKYIGEGWGLTNDDKQLIMSNGSSTLFFRDTETFSIIRRLEVKDGKIPVSNLNELEYINGKIYANVWMTNQIVVVDPKTGNVEKRIDISKLVPEGVENNVDAVANGIAYESESKKLLVTGKFWPKMYLINP
jgi:glutamine cyclotransferase